MHTISNAGFSDHWNYLTSDGVSKLDSFIIIFLYMKWHILNSMALIVDEIWYNTFIVLKFEKLYDKDFQKIAE